jgi:aryl-alcohol dehydrogenase-like predicted oxidoreductase
MQYVKLGCVGLEVSPICIGGMTYGDPAQDIRNGPWTKRPAAR